MCVCVCVSVCLVCMFESVACGACVRECMRMCFVCISSARKDTGTESKKLNCIVVATD